MVAIFIKLGAFEREMRSNWEMIFSKNCFHFRSEISFSLSVSHSLSNTHTQAHAHAHTHTHTHTHTSFIVHQFIPLFLCLSVFLSFCFHKTAFSFSHLHSLSPSTHISYNIPLFPIPGFFTLKHKFSLGFLHSTFSFFLLTLFYFISLLFLFKNSLVSVLTRKWFLLQIKHLQALQFSFFPRDYPLCVWRKKSKPKHVMKRPNVSAKINCQSL